MKLEISKNDLVKMIIKQLDHFFNIDKEKYEHCFIRWSDEALQRCEKNFSDNYNKYYNIGEEATFSPFHSGQYTLFLYYLSNTIYQKTNNIEIPTKIYYLNKIMNSVDWYFELALPDIFGVEHPLGSVMGRANYSDYFFFYQGCTIGGNKGRYPTIGKNVTMYANSSIVGKSTVGDYVTLSIRTIIKDENIPSCSLVFGQSPNLIIKRKSKAYMEELSTQFWK